MSRKSVFADPLLWLLIIALFVIIIFHEGEAGELPEEWYQQIYCQYEIEHRLEDGTRVDCLTPTRAVEFDFARKWYEAVGQSLYYAMNTGRKATIALIVEDDADLKYYSRAVRTINFFDLPIDYWLVDGRYE